MWARTRTNARSRLPYRFVYFHLQLSSWVWVCRRCETRFDQSTQVQIRNRIYYSRFVFAFFPRSSAISHSRLLRERGRAWVRALLIYFSRLVVFRTERGGWINIENQIKQKPMRKKKQQQRPRKLRKNYFKSRSDDVNAISVFFLFSLSLSSKNYSILQCWESLRFYWHYLLLAM